MKRTRRPKLTLKAAKALAIAEFGTAAGLAPHENNNADYQRYEMQMGKHTVIISNACDYWGIAYVYITGGEWVYYKIDSLEESEDITEHERKAQRNEELREAAACQSAFMFKALLQEHGLETCRAILDETNKKSGGKDNA